MVEGFKMIVLYSGTPGSGKSLDCAKDIYYGLKYGKEFISNVPINEDFIKKSRGKYTYRANNELTPDYLIRYSQDYFLTHKFKEDTITLIIDEAQLLFNAREWSAVGRDKWTSFFTQHRKYGYYIILIAQFDRMLDRQIRSLIEYEYIHRKVSNYGIGGKIISLVSGGNLFVRVQMWYPLHERVSSDFYHAKKRFYNLYDTAFTFES